MNIHQVPEYWLEQMERFESSAVDQYKNRKLSELTVIEKADIVLAVMVDYHTHKDVALRFRVSLGLVGRLVRGIRKDN